MAIINTCKPINWKQKDFHWKQCMKWPLLLLSPCSISFFCLSLSLRICLFLAFFAFLYYIALPQLPVLKWIVLPVTRWLIEKSTCHCNYSGDFVFLFDMNSSILYVFWWSHSKSVILPCSCWILILCWSVEFKDAFELDWYVFIFLHYILYHCSMSFPFCFFFISFLLLLSLLPLAFLRAHRCIASADTVTDAPIK